MRKKPLNWRGKDLAWYVAFVGAAAANTWEGSYWAAVVFGGAALLQLVEMTLHALSDAVRETPETADEYGEDGPEDWAT